MDVSELRVGARIGQRVILAIDQKARKRDRVTLRCDCGDVSEVYVNTLLVRPYGGCHTCHTLAAQARLVAEHQAELAARYPIGWRFGSRQIIGPPHKRGNAWAFLMRCDCGDERPVQLTAIKRGNCGICVECRNTQASEMTRARNAERQAIVSVREQIAAAEPDKDEVTASVEARYRRAELAELNAKFLYKREAKPLCSCGSTKIYEHKLWCQCMRCGKAWTRQRKGKVGT